MQNLKVDESIVYIGVDDKDLDLFESQYVIPEGISYNSYIIFDEKIAVMDTVDRGKTKEWLSNLESALAGKKVDYLVVSHMEPDHAANIQELAVRYPEMKVVGNAKTFKMIPQFFEMDLGERAVTVGEGDTLALGRHTLQFYMAPMVHWPEVMVVYEQSEKILFSADAFGKFGTLDVQDDWVDEARRYYFNIVGKYGVQVQGLLKKAAGLAIEKIYPLHGPELKENVGYYVDKYKLWSSYEPEDKGVLIAYGSIHGNTAKAAHKLKEMMSESGVENVVITDLARDDMSKALENAFRYSHLVLACSTYDGGLFPCMEDFLHHLKAKNYQKRKVVLIENGSWALMAGKHMKTLIEEMKNITLYEKTISIHSAMKEDTILAMQQMIDEFCKEM